MDWYRASGTEQSPYNTQGFFDYCGDATFAGRKDWRLPDIDELLSLMRGCVDGQALGDLSPSSCGVSDPACLSNSCADDVGCAPCEKQDGPGLDGCFIEGVFQEELHEYYWSASRNDQQETWQVDFCSGSVLAESPKQYALVRCVRDAD